MFVYLFVPRYLYTRCGAFESCCYMYHVRRIRTGTSNITANVILYHAPQISEGLKPLINLIYYWGGGGYLFECNNLFKKLPFNLCLGKGKDIPYLIQIKTNMDAYQTDMKACLTIGRAV